ncbi:MAG TPA: tetratricopeptide repeat protein, partial [Candidatus Deferrimicrobiaceae bacterium]
MKRRVLRLLCAALLAAALPGGTGIAAPSPSPPGAPGTVSVADFLELGMPLSARTRFRALPANEQGASPLLPVLLRSLSGAGYPEEAISLFEEVRPRLAEPVRAPVVQAAGEILWEQGDRPSACRLFRELSGRPDPPPEALLHLGRCFVSEGKTSGAIALFSSARAQGRGKLLAGYAEMARSNRAGALAAWKQAAGEPAAGAAARILALSADDAPLESARALREISRDPGASFPQRAAALEALSSLLLRRGDPAGALEAAREGLQEAERWAAAAVEAGAWDRSAPGGRIAWEGLEALFPFGEDAAAFRKAGRRFLARSALAEGALRLHNRLRETIRRLRAAETSLARSRDDVSRAIRRAEEIGGIYRAAAKRASAVRGRLRQAADQLALAEWGAEIEPGNFTALEVADRRIRFLRNRLGAVVSLYAAKVRMERSPPLSPPERLMLLTAQVRLDRIEQRIQGLESRMAFLRRAVWNRWKAEFASRASALLDRAEASSGLAAAGTRDADRIALRLREALETRTAWMVQGRRAQERLARRETLLRRRRADILEEAEQARGAASRELSAAIARREGSLRYLAARAGTELLIASPGTAAEPAADAGASRDSLRKEAFRHWEAVLASAGEGGAPVDEALYATAELEYEKEERFFFAGPGEEGRLPDDSGSLERFRRLVQDHPGSPYREPAWYGISLCLQEMGKAEESARAMRSLLAAYPDTRFADEVHLRLGEDAFDRYDFDRAAEEYRKVGENASPDLRATARFKLGWSLFLREKASEAAGAFLSSLLLSRDARKTGGIAAESLRMMSRSLVEAGTETGAEEFLARRGAKEH